MMACLLARDLGLNSVIVPPTPGVLSAYGGLIADIRNDFISTVFVDLDELGLKDLAQAARELGNKANHWLLEEQGFQGSSSLYYTADMRYLGQSYEIETALQLHDLQTVNADAIAGCFHREHARVYDHHDENAPVQVVNLRVVVTGTVTKPELAKTEVSPQKVVAEHSTSIYLDGKEQSASIFERTKLGAGNSFAGPAIISQDDCTTIVPAGFSASVDAWQNLVIESTE